MNSNIRQEEYVTLGDFIKISFERDQAIIKERFPKLGTAFFTLFTSTLDEAKVLDSKSVLTHEQKTITASLNAEASALHKELSFLNSYIASAGLQTVIVRDLKAELSKGNIEGAISKIEGVRQFILSHSAVLEAEGMATAFPTTLSTHKTSLAEKNAQQNNIMNVGKTLTATNKATYEKLYDMILKISEAGKLVFDGTVTEDEYIITKIISRMRAPKHSKEKTVDNPIQA